MIKINMKNKYFIFLFFVILLIGIVTANNENNNSCDVESNYEDYVKCQQEVDKLNTRLVLEKYLEDLDDKSRGNLEEYLYRYDEKVLKELAKKKYSLENGSIIENEGEIFIDLLIYVNNGSNVEEMINELDSSKFRNFVYRKELDKNRFSLEVKEDLFFKLIKDDKIERAYSNSKFYLSSEDEINVGPAPFPKNPLKELFYFILFLGLIISLLVLSFLLFRKYKKSH